MAGRGLLGRMREDDEPRGLLGRSRNEQIAQLLLDEAIPTFRDIPSSPTVSSTGGVTPRVLSEALATMPTVQSIKSAVTLPGDVYAGRVPMGLPSETEDLTRVADLAGLAMTGGVAGGPRGAVGSGPMRPVKAYHSTYDSFDVYDFSRLGQTTLPNVKGTSVEPFATNLAKLGAWASEHPVSDKMAAPVTLSVEVSGKGKIFQSLDNLEAAVRKVGGPEKFRAKLLEDGFGHVKVKDEEFGTNSYIGLGPEFFRIVRE